MTAAFSSKQPSEAFAISFDFADYLGSETISTATITAADQADLSDVSTTILDSTKQSNTTTVVYGWVRSGTSGHAYIITCKIVGSSGSNYELDGILPVDEVPGTIPASGSGLVTGPVLEPITLSELKIHLHIDEATTEQGNDLNDLISEAREDVEHHTRRAIMTQTWDYVIDAWPCENFITIPFGNLQSITSIKWKDTSGVETTLNSGTDYLVETKGDMCGRVVLPYGVSWPSGTLYPSNPITIRHKSGWTTPELVPGKIKRAIKFTAENLYQHGGRSEVLKEAIRGLLSSWRLWDEF